LQSVRIQGLRSWILIPRFYRIRFGRAIARHEHAILRVWIPYMMGTLLLLGGWVAWNRAGAPTIELSTIADLAFSGALVLFSAVLLWVELRRDYAAIRIQKAKWSISNREGRRRIHVRALVYGLGGRGAIIDKNVSWIMIRARDQRGKLRDYSVRSASLERVRRYDGEPITIPEVGPAITIPAGGYGVLRYVFDVSELDVTGLVVVLYASSGGSDSQKAELTAEDALETGSYRPTT